MQCASMNRRISDTLVETSVFAKTWNGYRQSRCRLDAQGIPTEDAETETGSKESDAASDTENYGWGGRRPSQTFAPPEMAENRGGTVVRSPHLLQPLATFASYSGKIPSIAALRSTAAQHAATPRREVPNQQRSPPDPWPVRSDRLSP